MGPVDKQQKSQRGHKESTTGTNQWEHSMTILGRENMVLRVVYRVYRLANHPSCGK